MRRTFIILSILFIATISRAQLIKGDVNSDGVVDISDVNVIISAICGTSDNKFMCDVNNDNVVDISDVNLIINYICGIGESCISSPLYIYRNDGYFNAFMPDEVDSMYYTKTDIDGILHDDNQSYLVFTSDSTYRIPADVIDSISFYAPQTVVNNKVFQLTSLHDPYLSDCDTLNFTMSLSTPTALQPAQGNIVVSSYDCNSFPNGIMAKVISVATDNKGIHFSCEQADIEDIFDEITYTGYGYIYGDDESVANAKAKVSGSLTKILWNETWTKTFEKSGTTTTVTAGDKAFVKVTMRKQKGTPLFFQLDLQNEITSSFDFNAESSCNDYCDAQIVKDKRFGKIVIPTDPVPLVFIPKFNLKAYFKESATIDLDLEAHYIRTDKISFIYQNHKGSINYAPSNNAKVDVASLSMEGSMEIGLIPDILLSFYGLSAGLGFQGSVGIKEYVNFKFDGVAAYDEGLYSALKDSYARTTIPQSINIYAQMFGERFPYPTYNKEPRWGTDKYLLPLFKTPTYKKGAEATTAILKTDISRDLLLPVSVGMGYYDNYNNLLSTDYKSEKYQTEKGWTMNGLESAFTIEKGETYTAYPMVKIMGVELRAMPKCDFPILICPDENHPHAIDLGLPSGTKWCCMNVGAHAPEEYGGYYSWGETSEKSVYDWDTYAYGSSYENCQDIGSDIAGTSYDVAHVNMGGSWVMPSNVQQKELINNCSREWTQHNGVNGILVTGPNGGKIFLPAAVYSWSDGLYSAGSYGLYWSGSLCPSNYYAYYLCFYFGNWYWYNYCRAYGLSVRAVCP